MRELKRIKFKSSLQPHSWNSINNKRDNQQNQTTPGCKKKKTHLVVSYIQGLSESLKKGYGKHGIQVYF